MVAINVWIKVLIISLQVLWFQIFILVDLTCNDKMENTITIHVKRPDVFSLIPNSHQ